MPSGESRENSAVARYAFPVILLVALALAGCAPEQPAPASSTLTGTMSPTAAPDSTPAAVAPIELNIAGLTRVTDGESKTYAFAEPDALLAYVQELTGVPATTEDVENPWGTGEPWATEYRWDEFIVYVLVDGPVYLTVRTATIDGIPVQTASGVSVGDTRAEAVAAGAWDEWDSDGDGDADHLGIEPTEVEGTQSLSRPGEVGRLYVGIILDGDVVSSLQSPANDFSDI